MGEVLYEKKYPKESPEDLEELQRQLDAGDLEEHEMPSAEEFFRRLRKDDLYIPLPERKQKAANFIRAARKVSQLYELDITITKHISHISAEFCFTASAGLRDLLDVMRLADDIAFFANIRGYEIVLCLDFYTHAVIHKGRWINP